MLSSPPTHPSETFHTSARASTSRSGSRHPSHLGSTARPRRRGCTLTATGSRVIPPSPCLPILHIEIRISLRSPRSSGPSDGSATARRGPKLHSFHSAVAEGNALGGTSATWSRVFWWRHSFDGMTSSCQVPSGSYSGRRLSIFGLDRCHCQFDGGPLAASGSALDIASRSSVFSSNSQNL